MKSPDQQDAGQDKAQSQVLGEGPSHSEDDATVASHPRANDSDRTIASAPGAPTSATESSTPDSIGNYTILGKLGEGGMGVVYEAEQKHPKRRVALKVVRGGRFVDDLHVKLFKREALMLGRLDHPSIAAIYEAGITEGGQHFLAMELVRGKTFDEYLSGRPDIRTDRDELHHRLHVFSTICEAVNYAHQRSVIHRDLKPSNIVVVEGNRDAPVVKVLDFGLARIVDTEQEGATMLSEAGEIRGTLAYMSPEQISGDGSAVDIRSDVYALGVVLYQILSGDLPYNTKTGSIVEAARVILEEPPTPLRTVLGNKSIDADLETIIVKAMEKEPDRRYASAATLRDDIERYISNQPILARPPSTAYQLKKLIQRNKFPFVAMVGFAALIVAFGVWMSVLYRESQENLTRAVEAEAVAAEEAETASQVSEFLVGLFEVSDPGEARGNDVTAREILDKGAGEIRSGLAEQPAVQGRLMGIMGRVYRGLGLYNESRVLLEEGLRKNEQELGADHPEVANNLHDLGVVLDTQGEYEEAREILERALSIRRNEFGETNIFVARSKSQLASLLTTIGEHDEARKLFDEAIATYKETGTDLIHLAISHNNLGSLLFELRDVEGALAEYRNALSIYEQSGDEDPLPRAEALMNITNALSSMDRLDEALPLLVESLEITETILGSDHDSALRTKGNLSILYDRMGQTENARKLMVEIADQWKSKFGPEHPRYAQALNNLGYLEFSHGNLSAARTPLEESLRLRRATFGDVHMATVITMYHVANLYRELGMLEEARPLYLQVIATDEQLLGEEHPDVAWDLDEYASFLRVAGEHEKADSVKARSNAILAKHGIEP